MTFLHHFSGQTLRALFGALLCIFLFGQPRQADAASVRGTVTDASGARIAGAHVVLVSKGKTVGETTSGADGSFHILSGASGRLFLLISADNFRQVQTPDFYASSLEAIERDLVLEPAWARESIVVSATGIPTPEPQTGVATTTLDALMLTNSTDLVSALRMMPGVSVVSYGGRGSQTSLFIRGGASNDAKVLVDGVDVSDIGSQFDFGTLSTNNIESVEVYRGPNSNIYGAGAMTGVINITTPHGTTSFPSILLDADGGNLTTSHQKMTVAGTRGKADYLVAYGWNQTANSLQRDQHHLGSTVANIGWQPSSTTTLRGTLHYNVAGTGVPNAWDFYRVADDATQKDQDLYLSTSISNQSTGHLLNTVHYGATRRREQLNLWTVQGTQYSYLDACYGSGSLGQKVTITGANGASVTGQAELDCTPYAVQYANNRDQLLYNGELKITPHLAAMVGFKYENERGAEPGSAYYAPVERSNYDYTTTVHGDYKNRLYYTLGGSLEHYSLFGTDTTPRAGFSLYAIKPRKGFFSGTRVLFNYGDAVREPKLTDQDYSLYNLLTAAGAQSTLAQLHITPLAAPRTRTYEGGFAQSLYNGHVVFRTTYFHNQFGKELEYVDSSMITSALPGLTTAQRTLLLDELTLSGNYGAEVNSQAFRAQGVEGSVETGIGKNLFLRGGYTYLDAVVQRSFDSDNAALIEGYAPTYNGIAVGASSPLVGARPFRRPPHTGYFTTTYATSKLTSVFTSSFASRSDDSTFLGYMDANGGNSLLLPNRNLDHGFAKLDLNSSYQIRSWVSAYTQMENLLNQEHIAPIGYRSLPFNIRTGLRFSWGPGSGR